jgi:hypothetical protein
MVDVVYELESRDGRVLIRSAVSALLWGVQSVNRGIIRMTFTHIYMTATTLTLFMVHITYFSQIYVCPEPICNCPFTNNRALDNARTITSSTSEPACLRPRGKFINQPCSILPVQQWALHPRK